MERRSSPYSSSFSVISNPTTMVSTTADQVSELLELLDSLDSSHHSSTRFRDDDIDNEERPNTATTAGAVKGARGGGGGGLVDFPSQKWRNIHGMEMPNLRYGNFNKRDFSRINFVVGADFSHASLVDATFKASSSMMMNVGVGGGGGGGGMSTASVGVDTGVDSFNFFQANLNGATFLNTNLQRSNLQQVTAERTRFIKVNLEGSTLRGAQLQNATFLSSDLTGVDLSYAQLCGTKFNESIVNDAKFQFNVFNSIQPREKNRSGIAGGVTSVRTGTKSYYDRISSCINFVRDKVDDLIDDDSDDELDEDEKKLDVISEVEDKMINTTLNVLRPAIILTTQLADNAKIALGQSLDLLKTIEGVVEEKVLITRISDIVVLVVEQLITVSLGKLEGVIDDHQKLTESIEGNLKSFIMRLAKRHAEMFDDTFEDNLRSSQTVLVSDYVEEYKTVSKKSKDKDTRRLLREIVLKSKLFDSELVRAKVRNIVKAKLDEYIDLSVVKDDVEIFDEFLRSLKKDLDTLIDLGIKKALSNLLVDEFQMRIPDTKNVLKVFNKFQQRLDQFSDLFDGKIPSTLYTHYINSGTVKTKIFQRMIKEATKYTGKVGGFELSVITTFSNAMKFSREELTNDEKELDYILSRLAKIEEMTVTDNNWRDIAQTWLSLVNLKPEIRSDRAKAIIDSIMSNPELSKILGGAESLLKTVGQSSSMAALLSAEPGSHMRENGYKYQRAILNEIAGIQKIQSFQAGLVSVIGTAIASAFISLFNYLSLIFKDNVGSIWLFPMIVGVLIFVFVAFIIVVWFLRGFKMYASCKRNGGNHHKLQELDKKKA